MKQVLHIIIFLALFVCVTPIYSAMSGGDYEIYADSFGFVGGSSPSSSGGNFTLTASGEGYQAVSSTGGTFELRSGHQAQELGILTFSVSDSSLNLGTFSESEVSSSSLTVVLSTDSETGYSLAISEDGNLRDGSDTIDDVSDGSVTAGSEEYGIEVSGSDSVLSGDNAITGSLTIASSLGQVTSRETTVDFRGSISGSTAAGSYSHIVTFTATVNP